MDPYEDDSLAVFVVILAVIAVIADEDDAARRAARRRYRPRVSMRRRLLGVPISASTSVYVPFLFDLDSLHDNAVKHWFRFSREEIEQLLPYLGVTGTR
ncbi:hypothetical protein KEM52_001665 [Ascosphaera acerosa]|nr:hypothetical protein KEM52_001665 [Ascosphaera acerosa]